MDSKTTTTLGVTTTITEDDTVVEKTLSSRELPLALPSTSESIKDFLAKPFLVTNSVWNSTDVQGASLFGATGFGTDSLLEVSSSWIPKWKGFSMIKATIVYRLQMNANPFQSGKLLMHFLPMVQAQQALDPTMSDSYEGMHNYNITTKSMQPGVILDCRETTAILKIPYITPASHYPLTWSGVANSLVRYERGAVFLSVMSPLATGTAGEEFVNFSLYAHFEDVELVAPFFPEMSGTGGSKKGKKTSFKSMALKADSMEAKAMANTPVSNALSVAAKVAGFATAIPGLAGLAGPAQWMLDGASGVASFFGWSKPLNEMAPGAMSRQFSRFSATSDGSDYGFPLALRAGNSVRIIDGKSLTDEDEMSFAYLKSVPAMTRTVNWDTSQPSGTLLLNAPIGPRHIYSVSTYTATPKSIQLATGPPAWYLSTLFRQYRGGLKLNIKIAKTDYHSGRLEIVFIPRPGASIPSLSTSTMSLREIIDIREGNEITLDLPFLVPVPYLDIEQNFGILTVRVLNELRAPETASQRIQLLFFYSASADYELAVPGYSPNTFNSPPFAPQMATFGSVGMDLVSESVGSQPTYTETLESAELCVGEYFSSVRQLIARNNQIFTTTLATATDRIAIWPFFTSVCTLKATGIQAPKFGGDPFSFVSPMYAFYRGGMRVTVDTAAAVGSLSMTLAPSQVVSGRESFSQSTSVNGTNGVVTYFGNAGISPHGTALTDAGIGLTSTVLPYYSRAPISMNVPNITDKIPFNATGLEYSIPRSSLSMEFQDKPVYFRSVAEDFQFTYFVGCPPLALAQPVG